jgi:hypothetical protein
MSRSETLWPRLFWETLRATDPDVARLVHLDVWPGDDPRTGELAQTCDAVIAYGSDSTLAAIQTQTPTQTPFFGYGHAISVGVLLSDWNRDDLRGFARDVLMYGQGGCLSPHWLVESCPPGNKGMGLYGGKELGWLLFQEADALQSPPVTDFAAAHAVQQAHDLALCEGLETFGHDVEGQVRFTLICDYSAMPPSLPLPVGFSTVFLFPGDISRFFEQLGPLRGRVSCVGVAGELSSELRETLLAEGVSRIFKPGEMQTPPLDWPNGNMDLLAELARLRFPS